MQTLILIGYRGTGKTTIAQKLADRLRIPAVDSDFEIERQAGKSIANIFSQDGEVAFRELEESVITAILEQASISPIVLATGGGAITRKTTRIRIRNAGYVIWLTARPETILQRITSDAATKTMRPSLTHLSLEKEIENVMELRMPLYAETAHNIIDTDFLSVEDIVDMICLSLC